VIGHVLDAVKRFRRGLRDARDRAALRDQRWGGVAMAGMLDRSQMLVLLRHPGISRDEVWSRLARRWPDVIMRDTDMVVPSSSMTAEHAADLARRKRGIEPLRVVVPAQVAASSVQAIDPVPMTF
jgi:hypothetical protein